MQLLLSPILWVGLGLLYLFSKSKPKGTDLSIFEDTGTKAQTTNGTVLTGVTINAGRAKSLAARMWGEFDDMFTDEKVIMDCLKGLNLKDFMLVYDAFGRKDRSIFGAEGGAWGSQNDLIEWINFEIDDKENRAKLSKQFPTLF